MRVIEEINEAVLDKSVQLCRERNIIIPTFAQQKSPETIPQPIKDRLAQVGLIFLHGRWVR